MKTLRFHKTGDLQDVIQLDDVSKPQPSYGRVLVRILASSINPSDRLFVAGKYGQSPECPQAAGFEGCGIVEATGGGFRGRLFSGKRVCVMHVGAGTWSQYACVPAANVIPVAKAISDQQAATFFVNPGSALAMTCWVLKLKKGDWLLQTAASSSLAAMVIGLSKHYGFKTINVVRRADHRDRLNHLEADKVIVHDPTVHSESELSDAVRSVCSEGVGYAIDPVGGLLGSRVVKCLGKNGRLLAYGTLSNQPLQFSPRTLMVQAARVQGFWLGNFMNSLRLPRKLAFVRQLNQLVASGVLRSEIAGEFQLSDYEDAFASADVRPGKTLFVMD